MPLIEASEVLAAPVAAEAEPQARSRRGRGRREPVQDAAVMAPADDAVTAASQTAEQAPVERSSRRGTAKRRQADPASTEAAEAAEATAVPVSPQGPAADDAAAPGSSQGHDRGRGRGRRPARAQPESDGAAASTPAAAPRPAPPPVLPPLPDAEITAPADGALFGRYAVEVPGEEAAEVTLRGARAGAAWCTCLDFALSEDASCPHVLALHAWIQGDAGRAAAWSRGPQVVGSRIALRHGARHGLLWLPGVECPRHLDEQATALQDMALDRLDDQALPRLLRAAREAGHALAVDDAVWLQLAALRDARWRVHRLESLLPQGPESVALQALRPQPLLPLQVEAALFAVCAGRCILADDAQLQPVQQALAAAEIWRRHFGLERVLLVAPRATLDGWRRWLAAAADGWSLTALENVDSDAALHQSLAPELVIVQEPTDGGLWIDPDRAAALLRLQSAHAIVLPAADWLSRPAELPLRLAFVDAERQGAYAALLQAHGQRDEAGQLCGLQGLEQLRATLEPVLLMRHLAEVLPQLPERLDRERRVALPAADQPTHAALSAAVAATLARWQRAGWLSDSQQRQLVDQVQALRRWCAGDGAPGVAAAKAQAVLSLLNDADAPVAKLVVFSQWPGALQALQTALHDTGIRSARWWASDAEATRRAAVLAFQSSAACRVLLVADPGSSALELACPAAQLVHLDRPWNPRLLTRRFGRVHRRGKAHLVPATQLLLEGSFEDALQRLQAGRDEPMPDLLDANAAEGFVQGDERDRWLSDLAAVLGLSTREPA